MKKVVCWRAGETDATRCEFKIAVVKIDETPRFKMPVV